MQAGQVARSLREVMFPTQLHLCQAEEDARAVHSVDTGCHPS
ncbi:unnamed protein product [Gulo gulo]|uniref:Uncharacterized protein n=1 Tax=Gulo gulo TaxID=48420 RepID=A0A9X9LWR7_GULGU|nr:unnamed protein product [Gulo gulo]